MSIPTSGYAFGSPRSMFHGLITIVRMTSPSALPTTPPATAAMKPCFAAMATLGEGMSREVAPAAATANAVPRALGRFLTSASGPAVAGAEGPAPADTAAAVVLHSGHASPTYAKRCVRHRHDPYRHAQWAT